MTAMEPATRAAAYRVRSHYRKVGMPKGYRHTLEIVDDCTQQLMATCDVVGRPVHATLIITDDRRQEWGMKPIRKIMPSRWIITDPARRVAMQLDQKTVGKLVNPLNRTALSLLDAEGHELYRITDPRDNVPDRVFGTGPDDWIIAGAGGLVAKIVRLPRPKQKSGGILGALKSLLHGSDPGIVSIGGRHAFPAPVALGIMAIFRELTDPSAGAG